jgi:hypothetical protein
MLANRFLPNSIAAVVLLIVAALTFAGTFLLDRYERSRRVR